MRYYAARRRPSGFTILEMIIAATIALMIFGIGFYTITASQRVQADTTRSLRQSENARLFFDMIERDLQGAYPGWFIATKDKLVENDSPDSPTDRYDALRFFSRVDYVNSAPDGVFLVRYYVAPNDSTGRLLHQVRREVWTGYITPGSNEFLEASVATYANSLDNVAGAVFDEVDRLRIDYRIYNPKSKTFEPPLESANDLDPALIPQATHLLVRLFLKDDGRGNQKDLGVVLPRMYQKVIALPGAFKQ